MTIKTMWRNASRRIQLVSLLTAAIGLAGGCRDSSSDSSTHEAPLGHDLPGAHESPVAVWFDDATSESGLNFIHDAGPTGDYFMPQVMGSGAAFLDYDNDDRLDILLLNNAGPGSSSLNRLFHQEPDGRFRDVSQGSGLDVAGYGMGVAVGDVNNDGHLDVFVTEYGKVRLFINTGAGRFVDVTADSGLDQPGWGMSASFFDYDRDGWLDLVVANYLDYERTRPCGDPGGPRDFCGPIHFPGTVARLYHNLAGRDGALAVVAFEDVTLKSGLGRLPGPGLGVVCADFSGDHWPDILVANDGRPNHLWINQHDGTFLEEAVLRGIAVNALGAAEGNMGIAVGDLDGDGALDAFVTHLTQETHTLWRQGPRGLFQDRTGDAGLAQPQWRGTGFGTLLADFDADGDLDLAVVNGGVKRDARAPADARTKSPAARFWSRYAQRNQLFANDGNNRFHDVSAGNPAWSATPAVSRGLALGDINNDGAVDLLATTISGPARLYKNVASRTGHWLTVRAVDPVLCRDAYGAEVTVVGGGRRWFRCLNPAASYLCSNDVRCHFGLGPVVSIDEIRVVWPDGASEIFPGGAADRFVVLRKREGVAAPEDSE